jgi:hypothetical protein
MRYYVIDELRQGDLERIKESLATRGLTGGLDDIWYLPVPEEMLGDEQREHCGECGPYTMVLETGEDWLKLELLVRARGKLRCSCIAYATPELRARVMDWLDTLIRELDIPV